ncbi:hypothetical protein ACFWY5_30325 [Nonomuraea sp. NPDC059007]|uniref:hypothetical protein n=1 Tax=Nonomuraea sp. NPDC059007 TaxID=3346692 RepID=UPI0036B8426C
MRTLTHYRDALLARWPTMVGLVVLALTGPDAHVAAMIIILAALCYLGAAALGSRRAGWIVAVLASVLVSIGMATALDAIVLLLAAAAIFLVYGLLRGDRIDRRELGIQAAAFAGYSAIALTAMTAGPVLAVHLAALAAIGHGVWDVIHHRRDKVVTRSLTEFCMVLDFGLGVLLLVVTWAAILTA